MKTSLTLARLARLTLPILLATLLMSCKEIITIQKDPAAVNPAGEYRVTGIASYTISGQVSTEPVSGTLSVFAGGTSSSFYFLEKAKGFSQLGYQVKVSTGDNFSVEEVQDATKYMGTWYFGKQQGGGKVSANRIELDRFADTNTVSFATEGGGRITSTMPIRKHIHLIATKQ